MATYLNNVFIQGDPAGYHEPELDGYINLLSMVLLH